MLYFFKRFLAINISVVCSGIPLIGFYHNKGHSERHSTISCGTERRWARKILKGQENIIP